jgi:hypothetical protein
MLQVLDLEHAPGVTELNLCASGSGRRHRGDLIAGKLPLGEDRQHFASDISGRTDNRYPITHGIKPST